MKSKTLLYLTPLFFAACLSPPPGATPARPSDPWAPPTPAAEEAAPTPSPIDAVGLGPFSLPDLIALSLETNPRTRASWARTQAGYAAVGAARSAYYPTIVAGGQYTEQRRIPATSSDTTRVVEQTDKGPFATVDWLLFDFGEREARIDEQRHALLALNYSHNAAVQDVVLEVQRSYFAYISLKALEKNLQTVVGEARVSLEAAEQRRAAGVATIADVLQAQTALSRAELALLTSQGRIAAVRGAVLTAAGFPASSPVEVKEEDLDRYDMTAMSGEIEALVQQAAARNPRLAAARENAAAAGYRAAAARRSGWPRLRAAGRFDELDRYDEWQEQYNYGLALTFPVFTGFSYSYNVRRTEADAEAAEMDYGLLLQQRTVAVWNDYYANVTASRQIATTETLFKSAEQSYEVALGRYREGVGTIIDLLTAEAALAQARAARVEARSDFLLSLAQLRHDLGALDAAAVPLPGKTE